MSEKIKPSHLSRKAMLYVRQSSPSQVMRNKESRRLQYAMKKRLLDLGWREDDPFRVTLRPERLEEPSHWRKPRMVFVVSMGDLFHPEVPFEFVARMFGVMRALARHTFLVLTKRPGRLAEFLEWRKNSSSPSKGSDDHIWLGVTIESQRYAAARVPEFLEAGWRGIRYISCEPLLGPQESALNTPCAARILKAARLWEVLPPFCQSVQSARCRVNSPAAPSLDSPPFAPDKGRCVQFVTAIRRSCAQRHL